ncbi:MAG: hypothetical protein J5614_08865 [Paludibacteraceae bacterium]|nr:hypothetical protein [Paludibacteraceae bacterium]
MSEASIDIISTNTRRRLSRGMRIANILYQFFLSCMFAVNCCLTSISQSGNVNIPRLYFEISSAVLALLPVLWSHMLDACKKLHIPVDSVASQSPSNVSPKSSRIVLTPPDSPEGA